MAHLGSAPVRRLAEAALSKMAATNPAVAITGPRQSGKTTLARLSFPRHSYVNLEDPDERAFATDDPKGFLDRFTSGVVLDEVQRCPDLFSYIQVRIDARPSMGEFVLTGSSQFTLNEHISQSLAGRVAYLQLLPFAYAELAASTASGRKNESLDATLFRGAYPPVCIRGADPRQWYGDYIATYVERDVRQMLRVADLDAFQRFVALCAGNTGQLLNLTRIAADAGVSASTAKAWLAVLRASYVVTLLQPHHQNFRKRLVKAPKLFFLDTGVACRLLRIGSVDELTTHSMRGPLFETWVVSELLKGRFNRGLRENLFFWRNQVGLEVDVLAERAGKLAPIEAKSGATVASDWFEPIAAWTKLAGDAAANARLIYGGNASMHRRGVDVVSWSDIQEVADAI